MTNQGIEAFGPLGASAIGIVSNYAYAGLPVAGSAGALARVTTSMRGLWMDQGSQWFGVSGEVFNAREFGLTGNGTTDDSAAMQALIDAAVTKGSAHLIFPYGTYLLNSQVTKTLAAVDIRLSFEGEAGATFKLGADLASADTAMINFAGSPTNSWITFRGLIFDGNLKRGSGLKVDQASERSTLDRCYFKSFDEGHGAWFHRCIGVNLIGNHFLWNNINCEVGGVTSVGEGVIIGNKFESNTGFSRQLILGTGITFMSVIGNTFFGEPTKSIEIADGAFCIGILFNSFEDAIESIYCAGSVNEIIVEGNVIRCDNYNDGSTTYGINCASHLTNSRIQHNVIILEAAATRTCVGVRVAGQNALTNRIGPNRFSTAGAGTNTEYSPADLYRSGGNHIIGAANSDLIGFHGVTPIERAVLATGSSANDIITALQNLGLVKQS